ncbi:methyltransferase family protein [Thalassotalea sediminis]|uniref:methyltransferase family protein n=1 Tax=Thalassotalea sediminis TaxID=1759089 RepID=UPI00257353B5|nr:isoprenylcysteine carboxylmethyltransferase family protein [Thalassotalea sediminis]
MIAIWLSKDATTPIEIPLWFKLVLTSFFLISGTFVCIAGVIAFRKANTTVDPTKPETSARLVNSGVYQYTRNPMYLGFSCWLIALCLYTANLLLLLFVVLFILYITYFQIKPEERILKHLFGQPYLDYCQQVRRWI